MWMLLHGFTGSPESWSAALERAELVPEPLRPILAGHGPAWRDVEVGTFLAEVRRLSALASSMDAPRFIAGYSLGARLALGILAENPELFEAALLIGVHPGLDGEHARRERRELDAARARLLRADGLEAFVSAWEQQPLFDSQRLLPEHLRAVQRRVRSSHDAEGLARSLESLGLGEMPSYRDAFRSMRVPVTLMTGSLDAKFRDVALDLSERHAHVRALVVQEAGHNLLLESSGEVADAMRAVERERRA